MRSIYLIHKTRTYEYYTANREHTNRYGRFDFNENGNGDGEAVWYTLTCWIFLNVLASFVVVVCVLREFAIKAEATDKFSISSRVSFEPNWRWCSEIRQIKKCKLCKMSGSGKGLLGLWLYRSGEQEWALKEGSPIHQRKNLVNTVSEKHQNCVQSDK